jgi:hypothetical protein
MSLVSRPVFKVGGKSHLLPIGSRQIATSFDAAVREPQKGSPVGEPYRAASAPRPP